MNGGSPSRPMSGRCASESCARRMSRGHCRRSSTCTAAAGCSATPTRTTGSSASSPSAPSAAVVFVEYDRSPEAHYPVALEQGYATAQWIVRNGSDNGLDPDHMAVAGDSVGGGMTAALALMASERGDVRFVHQSMYYPVTDAAMDTGSYEQFAEGYFLAAKGMAWFWDAYLPDLERRSEPYASPLRASDEQLARSAAGVRDRRRGRRAPRRGRGLRGATAGRWRSGHDRPLRRHHARLHDAQPAQRTHTPRAPRSHRPSRSCATHSGASDHDADRAAPQTGARRGLAGLSEQAEIERRLHGVVRRQRTGMTVQLGLALRLTLLTSSYTQQRAALLGKRSTLECSHQGSWSEIDGQRKAPEPWPNQRARAVAVYRGERERDDSAPG